MANNLNLVQIESPEIGKYSLILTSTQLKKLGKTGAKTIEKEVKNNNSTTTRSGRIIISPDNQENNENGFIGNDIDWSSFFPDEENEKIPELIEKAKKWENNLELAVTTLVSFINSGLGTCIYNGNIYDCSVQSIFGPFADLYTKNNLQTDTQTKKLLSNLDKLLKKIAKQEVN